MNKNRQICRSALMPTILFMKKYILFATPLLIALCGIQKVSCQLKFEQGQSMEIIMNLKSTISQEAMGQVIDLNVGGTGTHTYKVTNTGPDNSTLHHETNRIQFSFEGMGQKRSFDTDNEKDRNSPEGKPIVDMLNRKFDMVVDTTGKVLKVIPEKLEVPEMDQRMKLISGMVKDVLDVVLPPQKDGNSFFKILPSRAIVKGDTWTESYENSSGKFNNNYTLSDITDSTIVIDLKGVSNTSSKLEVMAGMELTTVLENKTTGQVILDRASGIIRSKTSTTESSGITEGMGQQTPITSKTSVVTTVSQAKK